MTAQIREKITIGSEKYYLLNYPLDGYLKSKNISFHPVITACWRGYVAEWSVTDDRLLLQQIKLVDPELNAEKIFDFGTHFPVSAEWFTGYLDFHDGSSIYTMSCEVLKGEIIMPTREMQREKSSRSGILKYY